MDGNTPSTGKCPVMHVQSSVTSGGTTNRDWWPNQLNLSILHQHDSKSDPMDEGFNYRDEFAKLDYDSLKKDLNDLSFQEILFQLGYFQIVDYWLNLKNLSL